MAGDAGRALPMLLDTLQLVLEQSMLSDTLFGVPAGRRVRAARLATPPVAGVRPGGRSGLRYRYDRPASSANPLIRHRLRRSACSSAQWWAWPTRPRHWRSSSAPRSRSAAYAVWYHEHHGVYALSEFSGEALWLRTTTFVDCSRISRSAATSACSARPSPLGHRLDPTYYGFHDPLTLPRLKPPPGDDHL